MNCLYIENNLIGYIENTLSVQNMQQFDEHLRQCPKCSLLVSEISKTYTSIKTIDVKSPELFSKIQAKLNKHHTTVIEFIPQHRLLFRIAASIIIVLGITMGILIGGKYSSTRMNVVTMQTIQSETNETNSNSLTDMDNEPGLAVLYPNE